MKPYFQNSLSYVNGLLDDFLLAGNVKQNKLQPVSVEDLWKNVLNRFEEKNHFNISQSFGHDSYLFVDEHKVDRVLSNLLKNAIEASPTKEANIWIKTSSIIENNRKYTQIEIGNQGSYIEPERKQQILVSLKPKASPMEQVLD